MKWLGLYSKCSRFGRSCVSTSSCLFLEILGKGGLRGLTWSNRNWKIVLRELGVGVRGLRHSLMVGLHPALKSRENKQSSPMYVLVALCPAG